MARRARWRGHDGDGDRADEGAVNAGVIRGGLLIAAVVIGGIVIAGGFPSTGCLPECDVDLLYRGHGDCLAVQELFNGQNLDRGIISVVGR